MQVLGLLAVLILNTNSLRLRSALLVDGQQNGSQCISGNDCGPGIQCRNGYCVCGAIGPLIFDKKKRCAVVAGGECSSVYSCVSSASCDVASQKCICDSSQHSPSSSGECRLNYGSYCSTPGVYCNADRFLRCNLEWNSCTCANDDEQIFHNASGSCLSRPSERCEIIEYGISPPCVPNASCVADADSAEFGTCVCADGFESTDESTCSPLHGAPCNAVDRCAHGRNLECSEDLVCNCISGTAYNESIFSCQPFPRCPRNSTWDAVLATCRIKATQVCDPAKFDLCVENAVCENETCQCTSYHIATPDGQCKFAFEDTILDKILDRDPELIDMDKAALLKCVHCHCLPKQIVSDQCSDMLPTVCAAYQWSFPRTDAACRDFISFTSNQTINWPEVQPTISISCTSSLTIFNSLMLFQILYFCTE